MDRRFFIRQSLFLISAFQALYATAFQNTQQFDLTSLLKRAEPIKWVFTGDSITQGAKHTHGMRSYPEIFSERIRWELGRSRDLIINSAVSGNTSVDLLRDLDWRVLQFKPEVAFIMLGTNDAASQKAITTTDYGDNLTRIINLIRENGAIPVLISPPTIIVEKAPERARLTEYVTVLRKISTQKVVPLVDCYAIWSNELTDEYRGQLNARLMNDPLHPNGYGHQEIARSLFKAIHILDSNAPTCGAAYYEGEH